MPRAFLQNFKALLPSWKFFDRVGVIPTFAFRAVGNDWIFWAPQSTRPLRTLLLNAQGNLELAKITLLERILDELSKEVQPDVYSASVSYRLARRWARDEILNRYPEARQFQFKVGFRDQRDPTRTVEDVLVSLEHEV